MSGEPKNGLGAAPGQELVRLAEAEIAETRARVAAAVGALERELSRTLDWREWIRRRPEQALALAFGVGWLLGRSGRR